MPEFRSILEKVLQATYSRPVKTLKTLSTYLLCRKNRRGNIGDAFIWVAVDETTDSVGRFVANLVTGKLNIEVLHFICSKVLHRTYHSTVTRFLNDGLKMLWPAGVHEEKVLILYSDAAAYMLKAATAPKVFYPNLIRFICLAHGLQRVAEEVTAKFPQVNKLISMTKKCF
jgi:hypothetical protein